MNLIQMIQQFNYFSKNFTGDPRQEVMKLVQSGQISQAQLNQIQKQATEFQKMMEGIKI